MLAGMGLAGCATLAVALPSIGHAAQAALGDGAPGVSRAVTLRLTGIVGSLSPVLLAGSLLAGALVVAALLRAVAARRTRRAARLWDCGAGPLSARMEYTATSFAEPLQRVFDNVVQPETDVDVTHHEESRYLVAAVAYRHRVPDRIERRIFNRS